MCGTHFIVNAVSVSILGPTKSCLARHYNEQRRTSLEVNAAYKQNTIISPPPPPPLNCTDRSVKQNYTSAWTPPQPGPLLALQKTWNIVPRLWLFGNKLWKLGSRAAFEGALRCGMKEKNVHRKKERDQKKWAWFLMLMEIWREVALTPPPLIISLLFSFFFFFVTIVFLFF